MQKVLKVSKNANPLRGKLAPLLAELCPPLIQGLSPLLLDLKTTLTEICQCCIVKINCNLMHMSKLLQFLAE